MPPGIDLTETQYRVLREVFARNVAKFDRVSVYGSRAMGRARPGSDVDLVVYGTLSDRDVAGIHAELEDSDLSIFADVTRYSGISHAPLKAEIDRWAITLFERADLLEAAAA